MTIAASTAIGSGDGASTAPAARADLVEQGAVGGAEPAKSGRQQGGEARRTRARRRSCRRRCRAARAAAGSPGRARWSGRAGGAMSRSRHARRGRPARAAAGSARRGRARRAGARCRRPSATGESVKARIGTPIVTIAVLTPTGQQDAERDAARRGRAAGRRRRTRKSFQLRVRSGPWTRRSPCRRRYVVVRGRVPGGDPVASGWGGPHPEARALWLALRDQLERHEHAVLDDRPRGPACRARPSPQSSPPSVVPLLVGGVVLVALLGERAP